MRTGLAFGRYIRVNCAYTTFNHSCPLLEIFGTMTKLVVLLLT